MLCHLVANPLYAVEYNSHAWYLVHCFVRVCRYSDVVGTEWPRAHGEQVGVDRVLTVGLCDQYALHCSVVYRLCSAHTVENRLSLSSFHGRFTADAYNVSLALRRKSRRHTENRNATRNVSGVNPAKHAWCCSNVILFS